jgi:hypothetical protein
MVQVKGRRVGGAVAPASGVARLPWVDNLKIGVIAGVVVAHAATAYVVDIDWYYQERTTSGLWQALLSLAMLDAVFVLGPLFLLGGVFAAASLARRGPGGFVHGRLLRLGVPLLLFVAVLSPLTNYLGDVAEGERPGLWPYLAPGGEDQDAGPLWFVAALLTFSLVYAAWRWFRPAGSGSGGGAAVRPWQLLIAAAVIAAASFAVRLRWPFDTSDAFLDLRWAEWPQGVVLFTLGVLWGQRGWLGWVPVAWSRRCAQVAAAGLAALSLLVAVTSMAEDLDSLFGGWHWQSLAFAVLEGVVAVALSLWLVAWFRRRWAHQGRLAKRASRGAYAAYVLHAPVLVMASFAARPLPLPPEAKFVLVAAAGVVAAFTVGWAVTRSALIARFV